MSSTKIPKHQRRQCSWTLYNTYFLLFNIFISRIAGWLLLSANIFHWNSGLLTILIPQSTRNSKQTNFPKSKSITTTGTGSSWSPTMNSSITRRSNPSHAAKNVISPRTASVPAVMPLNLISTATTAGKVRSNARSATQTFHRLITVSLKSTPYAAPTVEMLWYIKKIGNTLSSTNAWIPNALTISTILKK